MEHLRKVSGLFKVVTLHAPSVLQLLPVDFALVDGLVALSALRLLRAFLLFFLLFHVFLFLRFLFLCLLCRHLFLHLLLIREGVDFVRCKDLFVLVRMLKQVFHHAKHGIHLVCRDAVETEAAGFLALPEEVLEEVVQHVAVSVELQETLRVLRFRGGALGGAVGIKPGYHADLARLLVADYQHVLFVFFLCHLKNVLMVIFERNYGYEPCRRLYLLF